MRGIDGLLERNKKKIVSGNYMAVYSLYLSLALSHSAFNNNQMSL